MAERTPEQKAESAAKAKETRARNKKVKSAVTAVESNSMVGRIDFKTPRLGFGEHPQAIRGSKAIERNAVKLKGDYYRREALKAERAEQGFTPLGETAQPAPRTTSEGLPIGRRAGTTSTRGHGSTAEHVRQLEATANLLGVSTEVSTRGQIRGLSRTSPVEPPHPTLISHKGEPTQVLYTDKYDRAAPIYRGQSPSSADFGKWDRGGRPDLLDVVQQHQNIATPGGINRGPTDKVDTRRGARGAFSGMNPEELQDAVKAEILPDRVNRAVSDLMRPGTFNRARKIQKPWGVGSELTPEQKEKTDTVRVTKGKKTTTMTQAKHQERAEKRIAKRKKAEGGY